MRLRKLLATIGIGLLALAGTAQAARDQEASSMCLGCHEEHQQQMAGSRHAVAADPRAPTCVSCHGASEKHAGDPTEVKPDRRFKGKGALLGNDASASCLGCHEKDAARALWATSSHPAADVGCTSCHKVHVAKDRALAKATQPAVCYTCHQAPRAQANLAWRHPIAEGKMACSDCHAVHGSAGPKLAKKDSTNDTCFLCHAEKRGPFVHQHQPVTEDCASCHSPHGSSVAAMLKARAPILCQQCHTPHVAGGVGALGGQPGVFPPAVPGQARPEVGPGSTGLNTVNMWQARSCMNCHTQVHGSNNPASGVPLGNPTPQLMFR
jgi:DmsE family decaheme c-type cytochrome